MESYYDATKIIPSKVDAYQGIVKILLEKNRIEDALDIVEKTAKSVSNEGKSILYVQIGDYYYSTEQYQEALNNYEKAREEDGKNSSANLGYAKALLQKSELEKAMSIIKNGSYEGDLLSESQLILSYIQSVSDIETSTETLTSVDATESWSIYFEEMSNMLASLSEDTKYNATKLARVYINNGYPYLAIQILEPQKDDFNEYLDGLYFLGRAYYEYGDNSSAIEQLDKAALLGGYEIEIFWTEARAYLELKDLESSINMYDKAVAYSGESIQESLANEYIQLLVENNQLAKAETGIKAFLNYNEEAWTKLLAIYVYYNSQQTEKVDYYINELSEMEMSNDYQLEYLYWKGFVEIEKDELSNAKITLADLYALDKYNPKYYYLLGKLEFAQDNTEEAINALEKSLEYDLNYEITDLATKLLSRID
jgi:tetratricopeptide (TPR) repeat protein